MTRNLYRDSARFYDEIYSYKDYEAEAEKIHRIISSNRKHGRSILDLACGTGTHITYLKKHYQVEGLDINPDMLRIARQKHPDVTFHRANMTDFNIGKKYDAIVCLFSAIGHVKTVSNLRKTLRSIKKHLLPGGIAIIEPWFSPKTWKAGTIHANFVDQPLLKIARISISYAKGRISNNKLHHLVGTPSGIEYFVETLEMGLFTREEYLVAFHQSGLKTRFDPRGLIGRGLYIGTAATP